MRAANAKRFMEQCQRDFEVFKKERLASGELECQKLINAAQAHLTQVVAHHFPILLFCITMVSCSAMPCGHAGKLSKCWSLGRLC